MFPLVPVLSVVLQFYVSDVKFVSVVLLFYVSGVKLAAGVAVRSVPLPLVHGIKALQNNVVSVPSEEYQIQSISSPS